MTTEPLLTISAFARAVDLAPSTLRYYDEAGLLTPAEVDPRTGYRYYTADLERRATLIRRMRQVGLSVDAMRLVLAGGREEAARILRAHADGAHRSAARAAEVVDEILAALDVAPASAEVTVTVDGAELSAAIRRVARAASPADAPLSGVLLDCADGAVTVVATDRYWMALWSVPTGEPAAELRTFVPTANAIELADVLAGSVTATLTVSADWVRVDGAGLAAGPDRFPAYRLILPGRSAGRATVERSALAAAVSDATGPGDAGPVRFAVADLVHVGGYGDAPQAAVPATITGAPVTLWFAADLLGRALDTLVGESVTVAWTAPDRAVRLSPVEQRRMEVLVMPVRPPR